MKNKNKKIFKELYDDFNVPINNRGGYIEMGGFVISLLIFLLLLFFVIIPVFGL